jgi:glycogen synthase
LDICLVGIEIIPSKNGGFTGGLVNNVIRIAKNLTDKGHNVRIITSDINDVLGGKVCRFPWAELCPIRTHGEYCSMRSNLEFLLKFLLSFLTNKEYRTFDIIHFHSAYAIFSIIPTILNSIYKMPTVFTLYSPVLKGPLNDRKGLYQLLSSKHFSKICLFNAGELTVVSENIKSSLSLIGLEGRCTTFIPPLIDIILFNPHMPKDEMRGRFGLPLDVPIIFYCGNWAVWKGVDLLIEAMPDILKEFPHVKLVTAWGEPYDWYDDRKNSLSKRISDLDLSGAVIEFGVVRDINQLMATSDFFIAPFRNTDGVADQPLSLLEAMACGKPVIATRVGGITEIIKHGYNGLLIEPESIDEIKGSLLSLLKNKAFSERLGANAAKYVAENYSMLSVINNLEKLYRKVINNHRGN